jgi:hypothetical protein
MSTPSSICKTSLDHTSFRPWELDGEHGFQISIVRGNKSQTRWVSYDSDGAWIVHSSHWKVSNGQQRKIQERDLTPQDIHTIETLVADALQEEAARSID